MKSQNRVAFFSGTFDPIHLGHVNLVKTMMEKWLLDQVIVSPVFCSPFKENDPPKASPKQRFKMCQLAFEDMPAVQISDREIKRGGASFTIESVEKLSIEHGSKIFLMLSEDVAEHLLEWKDADLLLEITIPLINNRKLGILEKLPAKLQENVCTSPYCEVSSTEIRARLKNKLDCKGLVPDKVLDFIYQNDLY
ncbi:MAG: hypothetical protein ChlgKO_04130 [Chlamydiales bacterium]